MFVSDVDAFHVNRTEAETWTTFSTDQTKSDVLASDEIVLLSSVDDTTLLVDHSVSGDGNVFTGLKPQISVASFSRDLVPSDMIMGESDKTLSKTAVSQQQQQQFDGKASMLLPLHILLDFNGESSCVLSDSLPSSNAEMTHASLPASPVSNIQLRDPHEADYPRMVVKNFEEEYYSSQRTDDYLNFIRFGYRGEVPKSPEPHRRLSMPAQGNARSNYVSKSRRDCLLGYGKPVGPAATISHFGLERCDRRPSLFGRALVNDLEREYEKLQSIFAAWQLSLRSDTEKTASNIDSRAESQVLQQAILSQHQLLRDICERILQMSPVSFEKAGKPNVSDVLEQMKKTEQQMNARVTTETVDVLTTNKSMFEPVVRTDLLISSEAGQAVGNTEKKNDYVAGFQRTRRTSYKKYREFLGNHPTPSPDSPQSFDAAILENSYGVLSSVRDQSDSDSAKGTPTAALRTSKINQPRATPHEIDLDASEQAQKALLLEEIKTFGGSSGLRRTPNSAKSADGVFTFKQFQ
ncbi:hypothetical protein TTRE_0000654701 [Trichuris trichiura]|uniref:Uncharacterized protein n=1 Tax=Trichuris trichiura TaxID=36087 RepID=A0A077ZI12_TRITR|nr:hypothetical protein TTRE_0000654701 [Trichuris trichiura]